MAWWVWLLVGLGLLGFEMLTPGGFFILFFGLGALVVGALAGLGLTEPVWLQWLLFSVLSVGSLLRYEIKNITPPADIIAAMEKQMRAEREKRASVLTSEGDRDAAVNVAEGDKQQVIKASEAKRQQQVNEAEGAASAILAIANATAEGIRKVADAIQVPGGYEAVQLRVAEQYVNRFGELAKTGNTLVLPANLADVGSMIALAMNVIRRQPEGRP
jgi:membrane protein implicated in regulation of membrane protease activity